MTEFKPLREVSMQERRKGKQLLDIAMRPIIDWYFTEERFVNVHIDNEYPHCPSYTFVISIMDRERFHLLKAFGHLTITISGEKTDNPEYIFDHNPEWCYTPSSP